MKKVLSIITAGLVISLSGFDLELKEGWQNKGALEDINVTCFNNLSIESVWYYDKGVENWKVYFPNNPEFMDILPKDVENLTFIPKGEGFWVNTVTDTIIDTNNTIVDNCKINKFVDTPVNFELDDIKNKSFKLYIFDKVIDLNFNEKGEAKTIYYYGNVINLKFKSGLIIGYDGDNKKISFYKKIASNEDGVVAVEYRLSEDGVVVDSELLPFMEKDLKAKDMETYLPYTLYTNYADYYEKFDENNSITSYVYDSDSKKYVENNETKEKFTINKDKAIEIKGDSYNWEDSEEHNITSTSTETIQIMGEIGRYDLISRNYFITDSFSEKSYKDKKWEDIFDTDKNISMFDITFTPDKKIYNVVYGDGNYTYKDNNLTVYHKYCGEDICDEVKEEMFLDSETGKVTKKYSYKYIELGSQTEIVKPCAIESYKKLNKKR